MTIKNIEEVISSSTDDLDSLKVLLGDLQDRVGLKTEPVFRLKALWHARGLLTCVFEEFITEIHALFSAPPTTLEGSIGLIPHRVGQGLELHFLDRKFLLMFEMVLYEGLPVGRVLVHEIMPDSSYPSGGKNHLIETDGSLYFDEERNFFSCLETRADRWNLSAYEAREKTFLSVCEVIYDAYEMSVMLFATPRRSLSE